MMKPKVIRVEIRKGTALYFSESLDMPSLQLAFPERVTLIEEIGAVIKRVYEREGSQIRVEEAENTSPNFATWVVSERLREACG